MELMSEEKLLDWVRASAAPCRAPANMTGPSGTSPTGLGYLPEEPAEVSGETWTFIGCFRGLLDHHLQDDPNWSLNPPQSGRRSKTFDLQTNPSSLPGFNAELTTNHSGKWAALTGATCTA